RPQTAAVDLNGEGSEVVLGVQVNGIYDRVGKRLEENRPVIDEPRTAGQEERCRARVQSGRRAGREMRHRRARRRIGPKIEHDDLDGVLTVWSRPEVRESDPTAVGAEGYRRGQDEDRAQGGHVTERKLPEPGREAEALVTARGAEETRRLRTIGANVEYPVLLRPYRDRMEEGRLVIHLEHDGRPVRAHSQALQWE